MADIRGVGKKITYREDNPVSRWIEELRERRRREKREPRNDAERKLLAQWLGFRGRAELEEIVGSACYAYAHFEMDAEWRYLLADHIRTEAGHGWGYIQQANAVDPSRDYSKPDPDFEREYGLVPRVEFQKLQRRDFLSYLIAGNLWPYGHCTAATRGIQITNPRVLEFERTVVHAQEREHHDAILQKLHDYVWQLIEEYGEAPIRKKIAAIDAQALNSRSRAVFDPPLREFLRKHFDVTIENVRKFHEWREYLYLNVLGFPPESVFIRNWPPEIPQPMAA
ncbi:MAG TPA: hypothetical protein VNL14_01115 [Candidatus Acidoferrales bacterium]|nr:hypothetical protein [Candidatus Acidoferrales bacterium]